MDMNQLLVFERVCTLKSFTAAAVSLGLKKSSVSMKIAALENRLGVKLLNRTTRKISLTEAGQNYFEQCKEVINKVVEVEDEILHSSQIPKGLLRVSMPMDFGLYCIHHFFKEFSRKYPQIILDIKLTHQDIDPNDQGVDLVIRPTAAGLRDSGLIVKKIFDTSLSLYVSADYLKKSRKKRIHQENFDFIHFDSEIETSGQIRKNIFSNIPNHKALLPYKNKVRHVFSDMYACKEACVAGYGVAVLPSWLVRKELQQHKLMIINKDAFHAPATFYALYSDKKWMPKKTDLFLDALKQHFNNF